MWHASIASRMGPVTPTYLRTLAEAALMGVGDAALGEWFEIGEIAGHLRRRLSPSEAEQVGPVVDVRGTWESQKRLARMQKFLPPQWRGVEE